MYTKLVLPTWTVCKNMIEDFTIIHLLVRHNIELPFLRERSWNAKINVTIYLISVSFFGFSIKILQYIS